MFEAVRRAEAMGLVEPGTISTPDASAIPRLVARLKHAGIATAAADRLVGDPALSVREVPSLLESLIAALEASPVPKFEWNRLTQTFDPEDLAALLHISPSSLKRYQSGERTTPDLVAARLHFLALVVGDLSGSYNPIGIRRWFHRKRTQLDGQAPSGKLRGDWDPYDEGPARVRALARELVTLSGT
jgi:hypothetical protein